MVVKRRNSQSYPACLPGQLPVRRRTGKVRAGPVPTSDVGDTLEMDGSTARSAAEPGAGVG